MWFEEFGEEIWLLGSRDGEWFAILLAGLLTTCEASLKEELFFFNLDGFRKIGEERVEGSVDGHVVENSENGEKHHNDNWSEGFRDREHADVDDFSNVDTGHQLL